MLRKLIDEFLEKQDKISKYKQGMQLLKESGFIDLLRRFGYPDIIDQGNNVNAMAVQAARSHGFQNAVSHLEFFIEMYALKKEASNSLPTFGAEQIIRKEKLMSEEELNKITGGKI